MLILIDGLIGVLFRESDCSTRASFGSVRHSRFERSKIVILFTKMLVSSLLCNAMRFALNWFEISSLASISRRFAKFEEINSPPFDPEFDLIFFTTCEHLSKYQVIFNVRFKYVLSISCFNCHRIYSLTKNKDSEQILVIRRLYSFAV